MYQPRRESKLPALDERLAAHIAEMERHPATTRAELDRMIAISIELGQQITDEMLEIITSLDTDYIPMEL